MVEVLAVLINELGFCENALIRIVLLLRSLPNLEVSFIATK